MVSNNVERLIEVQDLSNVWFVNIDRHFHDVEWLEEKDFDLIDFQHKDLYPETNVQEIVWIKSREKSVWKCEFVPVIIAHVLSLIAEDSYMQLLILSSDMSWWSMKRYRKKINLKQFSSINFSRKGLRVWMWSIRLTDNHLYISRLSSTRVFFLVEIWQTMNKREREKKRTGEQMVTCVNTDKGQKSEREREKLQA